MSQNYCNHNSGFTFTTKSGDYPGAWLCNRMCGFFMNFNPELFPTGIAYMCEPVGDKELPSLKPSKY